MERLPTQKVGTKKRAQSPIDGIQASMQNMTTAFQAVTAKLLNSDNGDDKILEQLEKIDRLRKSYEQMPENTEEQRLAKRRRLQYLENIEERLLSE